MSGRALFKLDPTLFIDDDNAEEMNIYQTRVNEETEDEDEIQQDK